MNSVTLPYPPSANRYWRVNRQTGRLYRSEEAQDYIQESGWRCLESGVTDNTDASVAVRLEYYHDDSRRIDLDNGIKQVLDALQGYAYEDDKQIVHIEAVLCLLPARSEPYVVVTVEPREARTA